TISSGERKKFFSCSAKTASKSAVGILFRQRWQTYLGVFEGTYIFWPQTQYVTPAKRWTAFRAGLFPTSRRSSRMAFARSQSSSETFGSHGDRPQSACGSRPPRFLSPRLRV